MTNPMTTEIAKTCPRCAPDRLVVRTNKTTGHEFLGCPNWPEPVSTLSRCRSTFRCDGRAP